MGLQRKGFYFEVSKSNGGKEEGISNARNVGVFIFVRSWKLILFAGTSAWAWKAVPDLKTANKKRLATMNMRSVFLLRCSSYIFILDLLTLLLIGGLALSIKDLPNTNLCFSDR